MGYSEVLSRLRFMNEKQGRRIEKLEAEVKRLKVGLEKISENIPWGREGLQKMVDELKEQ